MDIYERIVEAVVQHYLRMKLNESEDPMDTPKGDRLRAALTKHKVAKAQGKNTRKSTLGSNAKGSPEYISRMAAGKKSSADSIEKINQSGVRKTHDTAKNDAAEKALAHKVNKIASSEMSKVAKKK